MKDASLAQGKMTEKLRQADVMAFFDDEPYLSRLTFQFAKSGMATVGALLSRTEADLKQKFAIRGKNMNRIRAKLQYFGLSLRPGE